MASVKEYVQGVVNAIGEVNTSLTQINAQDVPNKIRELKVQVGNKQLLGTYDGSSVEVTESGVVDIGAMLDEGKLPLEVNVNVASGGEDTQTLIDLIERDLTNLVIPNGATSIGEHAFYYNKAIINVTIPNSLTNIKLNAFYSCTALKSITIPDSVTITGTQAFYGCTSLESVTLSNKMTALNSSLFYDCKKLKNITIPDSVTYIDASVFRNCQALPSINIPSNVGYIGNYTFYGCKSLTSITFPNSVKSISVGVCGNCTLLESVTIGNSVTSFSNNAFESCKSLTNFTMSDIRINIYIGSGTSWGHLLTLDSLINTCKELINVGSAKTLTMGSANLTKIASTYVKFVDSSQTSIATDTKGDVVICESTDEGAMLLSDYALLKNWTLA